MNTNTPIPPVTPTDQLSLKTQQQVEDVAPEEVRKRFQHHHEWDTCPMVAEPGDSQEPLKEGEVGNE